MPRPVKRRRVCFMPCVSSFGPSVKEDVKEGDRGEIIMTVDEYETIRLIDNENLSQEECSAYMGIARTTVQRIYDTARKKIAGAIVGGLVLKIEGGNFELCDGSGSFGYCKRYCKRNLRSKRD